MDCPAISRRSDLTVFAVIFSVGLGWALYTNHAWEDYYITYRASKNLATGHGLTFTPGERVHSFTSPLGVLVPAIARLLTGNRSDAAALWIFRLTSVAALGGAGVFLWKLGRAVFLQPTTAVWLVALVMFDAKIVDFSTNGMETGFLLLFLAWTLYALLAAPPRRALQLGVAWAGLMWTRPDSFIYIGLLAVGAGCWAPRAADAGDRGRLLKTYAQAGAITTMLYLPWLIWAWAYYGSPVPNTITAKGLFQVRTTATSLWHAVVSFPAMVAAHRDILTTTFMPAYSFNTGWPPLALLVSFWVSLGVMLVWILPGIRREARVASFAFFGGQFYLTSYVGFPVPWYLPTLTVFALMALASLADQLGSWRGQPLASPTPRRLARATRTLAIAGAGTLLAGAMVVFAMAAHQLRWQQQLIEIGQRREIGLWLKHQSKNAHETVFLEPLGYIGFYSDLKMLDYPGLSSPEVIAARKRAGSRAYPDCWPELIFELGPHWIVLRGYEADAIRQKAPKLLERYYSLAKTFDVRDRVNAIPRIAGRGYLINDAYFEVYRRKLDTPGDGAVMGFRTVNAASLLINESWGRPAYDSGANLVCHAPSRLTFLKPPGARWLSGSFGIFGGAYVDPTSSSDGAEFTVVLVGPDGKRRELLRQALNPRDLAADRGEHRFSVELPAAAEGTLEIATSPGPNPSNAFDWTYWSDLRLEFSRRQWPPAAPDMPKST